MMDFDGKAHWTRLGLPNLIDLPLIHSEEEFLNVGQIRKREKP